MIAAHAGRQLIDYRRREDVRPAGRDALFRETVALPEESGGSGARGHGVTLLCRKPGLAADPDAVLVLGHVVDLEQLAALGPVLNLLDLIVVGVAGDCRVDEIRQRENL